MRSSILARTALFVGLALSVGNLARAGGQDTGGGNAIRCDDGKMYAWDFINKKLKDPVDSEIAGAKSAEEILGIIAHRLMRYNRPMANSINDFRQFNADPLAESRRIWMKTTNPLINLGDENRSQLPVTCVASAKPDFQLYQAVIRRHTGGNEGKVRYLVDQSLIDQLAATSPIQLSYLYIHEWLRDFAHNPDDIGMANDLLHGSRLYQQHYAKFNSTLSELGIDVPNDIWFDIITPGKYVLAKDQSPAFLKNVEIVPGATGLRIKGQFLKTFPFGESNGAVEAWVTGLAMIPKDGVLFTVNPIDDYDYPASENRYPLGGGTANEKDIVGVYQKTNGVGGAVKKNFELKILRDTDHNGCFYLTLKVYFWSDKWIGNFRTGYAPSEARTYCLAKSSQP